MPLGLNGPLASMWQYSAVFALLFAILFVGAEDTDLITSDLNKSEWTISNQNGSISFLAGRLPIMVLEALVHAGQVDQGDPLEG